VFHQIEPKIDPNKVFIFIILNTLVTWNQNYCKLFYQKKV